MKLKYYLLGNPKDPKIVIAHGLCGCARNWWGVAERLVNEGFCVELLDLRDHGESPWSDSLDYDSFAEDFIEHFMAHEPQKFIFIGHSLGGKLGMLLATKRFGIFKSYLEGLCLVDIAPKKYSPTYQYALEACKKLVLSDILSVADANQKLARAIRNESFRQFLLSNLVKANDGTFRWACNLGLILRDLHKLADNPLKPTDNFRGPTLVLAGKYSDFVKPSDETLIKAHFPAAKIEWLPSGHNPHFQTPGEFVKRFVPWAKGL